ncbi:TetR/AcrR family transcriptional regulator C-terminal domain-containing protein [Actinocrispum wychmicini]|uniref:TetR family transcriptional regulator n=1 Tax=Actinocrispum wychmicini TaxID=1213861 RepID=A0A4R2K173_9PSEU|nr:TetR/AcrR family transcriptional regulator C-terminal domain-containing protein [Actinocrispum wychmicini]TCO65437.1 TetR family transcriptional regulator [Actinocrispum wychmicini]
MKLSTEAVLDAALRFVDEHGLDRLSMRKLGAELGVEGMALYYYVPNKDALLDGMAERVTAAIEAPALDLAWQEWLRAFAGSMRLALLRHPAVLPLVATRNVMAPEFLAVFERALAVLNAFQPRQAVHVFNTVTTFVLGHVLAEAGRSDGPPPTFPAGYPLIERAVQDGAGDQDDLERFQFAIDALVDGFERRICT